MRVEGRQRQAERRAAQARGEELGGGPEVHPAAIFSQRANTSGHDSFPKNLFARAVGGLYGLFHAGDLVGGQGGEVAGSLAVGQPAVVLKAEADEQVDLAIRHAVMEFNPVDASRPDQGLVPVINCADTQTIDQHGISRGLGSIGWNSIRCHRDLLQNRRMP